jgi:hypothetical protein
MPMSTSDADAQASAADTANVRLLSLDMFAD